MFSYRITEVDSRIVVSTDEEPILVCASREVAHRAIADAERLAKFPTKLLLSRRVKPATDQ
jgi:hypothetical protein